MTFDVYRIIEGRGLVDHCGTIEAETSQEAEDIARLMYPYSPATERLDVEPRSDEDE